MAKPATVRTQTIEVKVPVTVPLDVGLTSVPAEPGPPPPKCVDAHGFTTVCNRDTLDYIDALRAWGRALAGKLTSIADLQPHGTP